MRGFNTIEYRIQHIRNPPWRRWREHVKKDLNFLFESGIYMGGNLGHRIDFIL